MGLIVDPNGNTQQMISVNAKGTNSTQLGTTSNGEPAWNQTPGGTTTDNTITWTNGVRFLHGWLTLSITPQLSAAL